MATSRLEQNESFGDDFVDGGSAIYTQQESSATVTDSVIADNESGNGGGGIYANNNTTLTVIDSLVSGNNAVAPAADRGGGGISAGNDSVVTILRSTLSDNSAAFGGGGVWRQDDGVLEIVNSTLSGNSTSATGGSGACRQQLLRLHANRPQHDRGQQRGDGGGGIFNSTSIGLFEPLLVAGTIVSGNLAGGAAELRPTTAAPPRWSRGASTSTRAAPAASRRPATFRTPTPCSEP